MGMDSKAAFSAAIDALELKPFVASLDKLGVKTFSDLAFCTPAGSGDKDTQEFEKIVEKICAGEENAWAKPRFRRLYHQAYAQASREMDEQAIKDPCAKVHMHPSDRVERTDKLRARLTGFKLIAENLPSNQLIDRFTTMLAKSAVKYIKWEHCTDRSSEMLEEPEVKALRVVDGNLLMQDVAKDKQTNINGELLWSLALRRRSAAADIAGVCTFESMDAWSNILLQHLLSAPPPGYRSVSWPQIRAADEALFAFVASECEAGVKAETGKDTTQFEISWKKGCYELAVRQHLSFLQGSNSSAVVSLSSSASSAIVQAPAKGKGREKPTEQEKEMRQLKHKLKEATEQIQKAQRLAATAGGWKGAWKGAGNKGGKKGTGKGKAGKEVLQGYGNKTRDNEPICYQFHAPGGCPMGAAGAGCWRGRHLCPKCNGPHPISECKN